MDFKKERKARPKLGVLLSVVISGALIFVLGYSLGFKILPEFVENQIWAGVIMKNGTEQWKIFQEIPFPFIFKVYMFNITNFQEVLQGAKPICKEVGPYVYKMHKRRTEIEWVGDDVVSYRNKERYEFDRIASGSFSQDDEVVILNPVWNSLIQSAAAESPEVLPTLNSALPFVFGQHDGLFIKISVKAFLFEGFSICTKNNIKAGGFAVKVVCSQLRARKVKGMQLLEDQIILAYFHTKNASVSGIFGMNSGLSKKEEFASLSLYENKSYLTTWGEGNNYCNSIESVVLFPPFVNKNKAVNVFIEDICRTIIMDYIGEDTVLDIKGYTFEMRSDIFDSPKSKKEHECFCDGKVKDLDGSLCLSNGLLSLHRCVGGPMLFSNPHLMYADPKYGDFVEGLQPDRDLHSSFVVLEPYTGTLLKMSKTGQFNMFIHSIDGIDSLENVSNAIVPLLWLEESMELPEKYANLLKSTLFEGLHKIDMMKWGLIVFGLSLIAVGMVCVMYYH